MMIPPPPGRPPRPTYLPTIYGRWEGAQVLLLALCGLPDLPFLGGRSLPTSFSAHLTILSATQRCTPPLACVRRTDPSPFLLFSSLSVTFDKISTRNSPSRSKRPTRARFQGMRCIFLTSRAELARQITHLAGRLSVTWRLQPGKFSRRPEPTYLPTYPIGVASRYLERPLPRDAFSSDASRHRCVRILRCRGALRTRRD